jgi:hypothetical protein
LAALDFGFSVKWWWLVDKMIWVRATIIPKLLKSMIPKEIGEKAVVMVSGDVTHIKIKPKRTYKRKTSKNDN